MSNFGDLMDYMYPWSLNKQQQQQTSIIGKQGKKEDKKGICYLGVIRDKTDILVPRAGSGSLGLWVFLGLWTVAVHFNYPARPGTSLTYLIAYLLQGIVVA
jgi:hypothetical protein